MFSVKLKLLYSSIALGGTWLILTTSVLAQITPDTSLPTNSQVQSEGETDRITEGTTQGKNLFHSFSQFSVNNGRTAYFDNESNIVNIFTRVTGNSISNIDGIIKANGTANLFLINPVGILFTENASLDIGGSFIGSTANSIKFSDGTEFSATNPHPQSQPLLSVNLPTALYFGTMPSSIEVKGQGHTKEIDGWTYRILDITAEKSLSVSQGQTLALIGGEIQLNGGVLQASAGRIELGSVQGEGNVSITQVNNGWTFGYDKIESYRDISLNQAALINTTGVNSGDIHLQGQNISLKNGSEIIANNEGEENGGQVIINASEKLELTGISEEGLFIRDTDTDELEKNDLSSSITADIDLDKSGTASDVVINTKDLFLENGGQITSTTNGTEKAANITVIAKSIIANDEIPSFYFTGLFTQTNSSGNAGFLNIDTDILNIQHSAQVSATSFAEGKGGQVIIKAQEVKMFGIPLNIDFFGGVFAATQGEGDGGNIEIKTEKLILEDGAQIAATTFYDSGKAGDITINASEITLTGSSGNYTSGLFASSLYDSSGAGGNITINTNQLDIKDDAKISASNFPSGDRTQFGTGTPGKITIQANNLSLNNGNITAEAKLKDGGNINLTINNLTKLENQSKITATAGDNLNQGNGGNIDFHSQFIIGSGNSEITAQAFQGRGGNIHLGATGLFFTPDVTISASSQLGADGLVEIKTLNTNPVEGLIERQNLDYPKQIAVGCNDDVGIAEGSLTYTGKGGIPQLATDDFSGDTVLDDLRPLPTTVDPNITVTIPPEKPAFKPIREAQGWRWKDDKKDTVILISNPTEINPQSSSSNPIFCRLDPP